MKTYGDPSETRISRERAVLEAGSGSTWSEANNGIKDTGSMNKVGFGQWNDDGWRSVAIDIGGQGEGG